MTSVHMRQKRESSSPCHSHLVEKPEAADEKSLMSTCTPMMPRDHHLQAEEVKAGSKHCYYILLEVERNFLTIARRNLHISLEISSHCGQVPILCVAAMGKGTMRVEEQGMRNFTDRTQPLFSQVRK